MAGSSALLCSPAFPLPAPARAQQSAPLTRLALVIGNADYPGAPLPTSVNDAGLIAETLAQVGFDVTAMANVDAATLARTLRFFEAKAQAASPDAVILVYLAGYGLQVEGDNFFVPIAATITRGSDVPAVAMRLSDLAKAIEAVPAKAHVFIEDLARASPFPMRDGMPLAAGLALVPAPAGSLYAVNAAPGSVAPSAMPPYGAYARALAEMIQTPSLDLPELFRRVRLRVGAYTNGAAVPWEDAKLAAPVALSGIPVSRPDALASRPVATLPPAAAYTDVVARDTLEGYGDFVRAFPADALTPRVRMLLAIRREALFWLRAAQANTASAYWTYMRRYPRRAHYYDARRRLAALNAPLEPPPRFDITLFPDVPPPSPDEANLLDRPPIIVTDPDWSPIPPPPPGLLPLGRPAFTDELAPPPLAAAGILPVPVPVALPAGAAPVAPGRLMQPFAPLVGEVLAETKGQAPGTTSVTLTSSTKGLISRVVETVDRDGTRTITQTGPNDAILSRTTITGDGRGATVVQTGPNGGVMTKAVTWTDSDGARSTLIRNGGNQIVADIRRNDQGIVVSATIAPAPAPQTNLSGHPSAPTGVASPAPVARPAAVSPVVAPKASGTVPPAPTASAAPTPPPAPLPKAAPDKSVGPAPQPSMAPRTVVEPVAKPAEASPPKPSPKSSPNASTNALTAPEPAPVSKPSPVPRPEPLARTPPLPVPRPARAETKHAPETKIKAKARPGGRTRKPH